MLDVNKVKERILSIISYEGPLLPIQISRKLEKDTIFAGAVLSELLKEKAIRVSNAKIGSSPLYYMAGQESKLSLLYNHLPLKEKETYEKLRQHQILKDKECDPATRVALRSIKDFSFPLENNGELYWRWHLTNEQEAQELIRTSTPEKIDSDGEILIEKSEIQLKQNKLTELTTPTETRKFTQLKSDKENEFLNTVSEYFKNKQIQISEISPVKKRSEVEGIIKINSDLGILEFLVLAKNKKTINEADLSLANDRGKRYKLPVLFLSNGEMTKKCNKYLEENLKGRIIFKRI